MATFNEMHAPSSKKLVATEGILMPEGSKTFHSFLWDSSVFPLEKQPNSLNFQRFFTCNDLLVAAFTETLKNFLSHSSVFHLEKNPKNLNFQSFYTSKRPFGGRFQ